MSVTVESQNGVWDLRNIDFDKTSVKLAGQPEYVLNALLTPEEFAISDDIRTDDIPDDVDYLTFRFRILLPDDSLATIARWASINASRIYLNGLLLGGAGEPGVKKEETTSNNRYISFTAWPENGMLEIVEQTSNFVHKDSFSPAMEFYVGNERMITSWTTRFIAYPVIQIGIYLLLFIVHLLLFLTLPNFRVNLWLALLCLMWAFRTGVIGAKIGLILLPWLSWEAAFRIEYLAIPVSLLLLSLSYHELFPGTQQRGYRVAVLLASPLGAAFILLTDTMPLSYFGVPMTALGGVAAAYVLIRILMKVRKPAAEQKLLLTGLGVLILSIIADVLYFNTATTNNIPGSTMETALILFSMFQMTAMLHATMRETAAAKDAEQRLAAENAALDRMDRLKSDLIATVSHELRTPLTVMSVYSQLAVKAIQKGDYSDPVLKRIDVIPGEAKRLANLSENLLNAFKEQSGTREKTRASIGDIVSQTTNIYKPIMDKKKNRQILSVVPELQTVFANADELTQVLLNLLTNANAHTENGVITVTVTSDGSSITVTVADTGSGIAPELLPLVFERNAHDEQGTGYGLAICREIIRSGGGEIEIESEVGKGTSVSFMLPVWKEEERNE